MKLFFGPSKKKLHQEINQLKEQLAESQKKNELFELVINEVPCNIYWKNLENKYLGCNSPQAAELGLSETTSVVGKTVFDFDSLDEKHKKIVDQNDQLVMTKKIESHFIERKYEKKPSFFLSIKKPLFNKRKKIIGMVGVSIDQTKQIILEKKLNKTISQLKIDRSAKDLFISNLSHDIRTPITGMLGLIDALKPLVSNKKAEEICDTLRQLTSNFLNFFNDILYTISAPGVLKLDNEYFDIQKVIFDVMELFKSAAHQKNLHFEVKIDDKTPKYVEIYLIIFKSILANLIGNAVKFTDAGTIKIFTKYDFTNKNVIVQIADTGIGIPKEKISTIFERFSKLHQERTNSTTSSGLGLFMVKKHVQSLKGKIQVSSKVNEGTTFTVTIPAPNTQNTPPHIKGSSTHSSKNNKIIRKSNQRVLIIEDTKLAAMALDNLLRQQQFITKIVATGQASLDILAKEQFDIIFLDLGLPDIDGIELLSKIKALSTSKDSEIIVLSGQINSGMTTKCIGLGAHSVYTKPFSKENLAALLIQ